MSQLASNDPRRRYPAHIAGLASHMAASGGELCQWTILHAAETRLDEHGMEVQLVLLHRGPASELRTYHLTVCRGRLSAIRLQVADRAAPTPLQSPALTWRA